MREGLELTVFPFFLVRLRVRFTPRGIERGRRGRSRSKGVCSVGVVMNKGLGFNMFSEKQTRIGALVFSYQFRYTRYGWRRRLIRLI